MKDEHLAISKFGWKSITVCNSKAWPSHDVLCLEDSQRVCSHTGEHRSIKLSSYCLREKSESDNAFQSCKVESMTINLPKKISNHVGLKYKFIHHIDRLHTHTHTKSEKKLWNCEHILLYNYSVTTSPDLWHFITKLGWMDGWMDYSIYK